MSRPSYIPLRTHSEYSLCEGIVPVKALVKRAAELGYPALALTDDQVQFGALKFQKAADAAGVKAIHGADILLRWGTGGPTGRITLIALTDPGLTGLAKLLTRTQVERSEGASPVLEFDALDTADLDGIAVLAGHLDGIPGLLVESPERLRQYLTDLARLAPGRLYLEVARRGVDREEALNHAVLGIASELGLPGVVAEPVYHLSEQDFDAQGVRSAIAQGRTVRDPQRVERVLASDFLPAPEAVVAKYTDVPELLQNTVELAVRATSSIRTRAPELPHFAGGEEATMLRKQAAEGLAQLLAAGKLSSSKPEAYTERLEHELGVIERMGFPGYFLIVADFIRWARDHEIPVGPGRGSGAGSLVAHALGITQLDPLEHDLLFERFLNEERISLPDFDVDMCVRGRDRVIAYVVEKYGADNVGQIITFSRLTAKAVVRDVARALDYPYSLGDTLARLIPDGVGVTLSQALTQSDDLRSFLARNDEAKEVFELSLQLEGLPRQAGTHAGGVIIAPHPLTDYCPLYRDGRGLALTQYDMNDAESVGLVKFDFLGLTTLTVLYDVVQAINTRRVAAGEAPISLEQIPMNDPVVYADLSAGSTVGIFQLESRGMTELIKRFKPASFSDLTALVALFRPGPLQSGMLDDFIARKDGIQQAEYAHPLLEPILRSTHGVIVYQEQVMQISQVLAGYSLGKADILRRAMGKKKPEEMFKQRAVFMAGAVRQGIDADLSGYIFDLMEKFAGYGFNKSHSAAYALLAWWSAWLKHYFPADFLAAAMSFQLGDGAKLSAFVSEGRQMQVQTLPPSINQAVRACRAIDSSHIMLGFGAVAGVGDAVIVPLIAARSNGPFNSLTDFARRVPNVLNGSALESLIGSGACDEFGLRGGLLSICEPVRQAAKQAERDRERNQTDMFGVVSTSSGEITCPDISLDGLTKCLVEKQAIGFYLTGHPVDEYQDEISRLTSCRLSDAAAQLRQCLSGAANITRRLRLGGYVSRVGKPVTGNGRRMALVDITDGTGEMTVLVFPDVFDTFGKVIKADQVLFFEGRPRQENPDSPINFSVDRLFTLNELRAISGRGLRLGLKHSLRQDELAKRKVMSVLKHCRGGSWPVAVYYDDKPDEVIKLGPDWVVAPSADMLDSLAELTVVNVSY